MMIDVIIVVYVLSVTSGVELSSTEGVNTGEHSVRTLQISLLISNYKLKHGYVVGWKGCR
jgi:hypothetical protein